MKLSLCIPTFRRFDPFLKQNLVHYLNNSHIHEIVICDEDGHDIDLIRQEFSSHPDFSKIMFVRNDTRLYAYRNKEKVVAHATTDWICLADSDNFIPDSYFDAWHEYVSKHGLDDRKIYMPIQTFVGESDEIGFDFGSFEGIEYKKSNIAEYDIESMGGLFNTGNYIFHKSNYCTDSHETKCQTLVNEVYAVDVILKNALMMLNGTSFSVVPNMRYKHVVHHGSFFLNHELKSRSQLPLIYRIYQEMS